MEELETAPKKILFTSNGGFLPSETQTLALWEESYFPFPDVRVTVSKWPETDIECKFISLFGLRLIIKLLKAALFGQPSPCHT